MTQLVCTLFKIENHDPKFRGYCLDADGVVWSIKNDKPCIVAKSRSKLNGFTVHIPTLIAEIMKTPRWRDYIELVRGKNTATPGNTAPLKRGVYIIAVLDENGTPKFSTAPKVHANKIDAIEEVKRLAGSFPGKQFAYFECMGVAVANGVTWT